MPTNDPTNDRYNPPGTQSLDFEEFEFSELEVGDLFWQTNRPEESNPWRKENQTQGKNLKTQKMYSFNSKAKVFQKI
tara:strand:+ start:1254 stop:1484 length:231 start_codon:yes stop_codon:yes gene_type:complete